MILTQIHINLEWEMPSLDKVYIHFAPCRKIDVEGQSVESLDLKSLIATRATLPHCFPIVVPPQFRPELTYEEGAELPSLQKALPSHFPLWFCPTLFFPIIFAPAFTVPKACFQPAQRMSHACIASWNAQRKSCLQIQRRQ